MEILVEVVSVVTLKEVLVVMVVQVEMVDVDVMVPVVLLLKL
jgi:hypothetical protein